MKRFLTIAAKNALNRKGQRNGRNAGNLLCILQGGKFVLEI